MLDRLLKLITRRSQVQILPPLPSNRRPARDLAGLLLCGACPQTTGELGRWLSLAATYTRYRARSTMRVLGRAPFTLGQSNSSSSA